MQITDKPGIAEVKLAFNGPHGETYVAARRAVLCAPDVGCSRAGRVQVSFYVDGALDEMVSDDVAEDAENDAAEGEERAAEEEAEATEEEEMGQVRPLDFEVLIKRPGKGILQMNCSTDGQSVAVRGPVRLLPPDESETTETPYYMGPIAEELPEAVATGLNGLLSSLGITEEFAGALLAWSQDKEEREYRHWLSKLHVFLK